MKHVVNKSRKNLRESQIEALNLSSLANLIYAYGNDLRVLHLNVKGDDFSAVHKTLNDAYDLVFKAYDTVAELAIARNEAVKNPSTVVSIIKPLEARDYSCQEAVQIAIEEGNKVLDAICSIEGYDRAVQPTLDNIIVDLDKILKYNLSNFVEQEAPLAIHESVDYDDNIPWLASELDKQRIINAFIYPDREKWKHSRDLIIPVPMGDLKIAYYDGEWIWEVKYYSKDHSQNFTLYFEFSEGVQDIINRMLEARTAEEVREIYNTPKNPTNPAWTEYVDNNI